MEEESKPIKEVLTIRFAERNRIRRKRSGYVKNTEMSSDFHRKIM